MTVIHRPDQEFWREAGSDSDGRNELLSVVGGAMFLILLWFGPWAVIFGVLWVVLH